jgi:hypothetical protein
MARLYSLGTWWFSSLAIALALLVPLTVPESAWADAGSDSANPLGGGGAQNTCPNPTFNVCPTNNNTSKSACEGITGCSNATGSCWCSGQHPIATVHNLRGTNTKSKESLVVRFANPAR